MSLKTCAVLLYYTCIHVYMLYCTVWAGPKFIHVTSCDVVLCVRYRFSVTALGGGRERGGRGYCPKGATGSIERGRGRGG